MARVLLIGTGPLPASNPERLGFPQLRTDHYLRALVAGGHTVRLVLLEEDADDDGLVAPTAEAPFERISVQPESPGWLSLIRQVREDFRPDVVVTAGPYEPARAAALTVGEEPLWVDVPGDPFAEAQAKSAHAGEAGATSQMMAAYAPAFGRADAFATISRAQHYALLGQLGVLGRLATAPLDGRYAHVVPAGMDFGRLPGGAPRVREPGSPLVVAIAGGYNTWFDADTLLAGLHMAMGSISGLRVVSTGGGIPGHHTATYESFRALALAGPYARRFTFHGWVPHKALPELLSRAHVGICLDRPGQEPDLGTRTRVLFYSHMGLAVVATPRSELTRELVGLRLIFPTRPGDPESLAEGFRKLHAKGDDGAQVARAQSWLNSRYSVDRIFVPLMRWLERPRRLEPALDTQAELAAEIAELRAQLSAIHGSATWRVSGAADRMLKRGSRRLERLLGKEDLSG